MSMKNIKKFKRLKEKNNLNYNPQIKTKKNA